MENKKHKKMISKVLNGSFYIIIILLIIFALANTKKKSENQIAHIFGYGFLSVQSDSMNGNLADSFEQGDMILVSMLDKNEKEELQIGDIVTYYDIGIREFNTHRIVEIDIDDNYIVTKADYDPITHNQNTTSDKAITLDQVVATHHLSVRNLGNVLDYMQTSTGFALCVILPVVLIFFYEGIKLIKNIMVANKEKIENKYKDDIEKTHELLKIEKEKIKEELMNQLIRQARQ